jgi:DNA repair exonuclease SbcCD nuclease subunit
MEQGTTADRPVLIGHIADTHLRDTQYATSARGEDFYHAFRRAVLAGLNEVDLFVLVGDIFDKARPSPRVVGHLTAIDTILRSACKTMLAVTGNHDWSSPTWLAALFQDRDPSTAVGIVPLDDQIAVRHGVTFLGLPPYDAAEFRSKSATIEMRVRDADVVLYHGLVHGVAPFNAPLSDPLRVDELPVSTRNKAWLLGDIHINSYQTIASPSGGQVLVGYPGSLEMCDASESTEKRLPIIAVSPAAARVSKTIPLAIRPFLSAEIRTAAELEDVCDRLRRMTDPVVVVRFDRALPQTVNAIHAIQDPQRAIIRCYPLPRERTGTDGKGAAEKKEAVAEKEKSALTLLDFVHQRFAGDPELDSVAQALAVRGAEDAAAIFDDFIQASLAKNSIREEFE